MVVGAGNVFFNINLINFTISKDVLAVNEVAGNKDVFVIYPNPGKGILNIKFPNTNEGYDLTIYDVSGKLVLNKLNNKPDHNNLGVFNVAQLIKGDYLIKVKTKTFERTIKWIKE